MTIPEKRDPLVVERLIWQSLLTQEPVELRDDEIEEFEASPIRQAAKEFQALLARSVVYPSEYRGNFKQ